MIFSTKGVTQAITSGLTFVAGVLIARLGLHADPAVTAAVPGVIAWLAGILGAFFVKEEGLLAPTLAKVQGRIDNDGALINERLRNLEDKLPGPLRLAAQTATTDLEADAAKVAADVKADAPAVVADVEAGNYQAAEAQVVDDAKTEEQKRIADLESQLKSMGVDPATGAPAQPAPPATP